MMAQQWPYQSRYVAVNTVAKISVAKKLQRYLSPSCVSMADVVHIMFHHCTSVINVCFQNCHGSGKERRMWAQDNCQSAHKSTKSNHTATPNFKKVRRCSSLRRSEVRKRLHSRVEAARPQCQCRKTKALSGTRVLSESSQVLRSHGRLNRGHNISADMQKRNKNLVSWTRWQRESEGAVYVKKAWEIYPLTWSCPCYKSGSQRHGCKWWGKNQG